MQVEPKDIKNNDYLIGSKPETIKADIMYFKEEVLVEFKQLSKKLEEKYTKINKELKDNIELFNTKLSQFNFKLLELSSRIVIDTNMKQKLNDLLIFKEKAETLINSNQLKISKFSEDAQNKINRIDDLLRGSFIFPGLIGSNCKYKNFREFIEFIYIQINSLNDFKQKNLIDLGLYKTKIEYLFNATKMKMDNVQKEANFHSLDNVRKSEEKIFQEISLRDEKLKDIRFENHDYFLKLNKNMKYLNEDVKLLKDIKENFYDKFNKIEQKIDNFNKFDEKYNNMENQVSNLNDNLLNAINYMNRNGANLKIINNTQNPLVNKTTQLFFKNAKNTLNKDYFSSDSDKENTDTNVVNRNKTIKMNKKNKNDDENTEEDDVNEKNKRRIKSSKGWESDITKYVKGEITAEEIGMSSHYRYKKIKNYRNKYLERIIDKKEYQKSLTNRGFGENKTVNELIIDKKNNNYTDELFKDDLYLNFTKSTENGKILKTEKRMTKSLSSYRNLINIDLKDLDAKFGANQIGTDFFIKSCRNKNNNNLNKRFKEINHISNKNNYSLLNYIKEFQSLKTQDLRKKFKKNLNLFPKYKVFSLKDFNQEISAKLFLNNTIKNNMKINELNTKKNNNNRINFENSKNIIKLNNNLKDDFNRKPITKIKQKILSLEFDNHN